MQAYTPEIARKKYQVEEYKLARRAPVYYTTAQMSARPSSPFSVASDDSFAENDVQTFRSIALQLRSLTKLREGSIPMGVLGAVSIILSIVPLIMGVVLDDITTVKVLYVTSCVILFLVTPIVSIIARTVPFRSAQFSRLQAYMDVLKLANSKFVVPQLQHQQSLHSLQQQPAIVVTSASKPAAANEQQRSRLQQDGLSVPNQYEDSAVAPPTNDQYAYRPADGQLMEKPPIDSDSKDRKRSQQLLQQQQQQRQLRQQFVESQLKTVYFTGSVALNEQSGANQNEAKQHRLRRRYRNCGKCAFIPIRLAYWIIYAVFGLLICGCAVVFELGLIPMVPKFPIAFGVFFIGALNLTLMSVDAVQSVAQTKKRIRKVHHLLLCCHDAIEALRLSQFQQQSDPLPQRTAPRIMYNTRKLSSDTRT